MLPNLCIPLQFALTQGNLLDNLIWTSSQSTWAMNFKNTLSSSLLKLIEMIVGQGLQSQVGRLCRIEAKVFTFPFNVPVLLYPAIGCRLPENEMGSSEESARALTLLGQVDTSAARAHLGSGRGCIGICKNWYSWSHHVSPFLWDTFSHHLPLCTTCPGRLLWTVCSFATWL